MTYGSLRLRLSQLAPGIGLELIDGWIQDRYTEILDELPWKRLESEIVIQVPPSYAVGTVSVTQGSTALTGVGTTFTSAMTGRVIRIGADLQYYTFTYVSAATGTLDRGYEEPSVTGASYRIDQNIFQLPASVRIVRGVRPLGNYLPIDVCTPGDLNRLYPTRTRYAWPMHVAPTWDSATDPPVLRIEAYPIPSSPDPSGATVSFAVDCISDASALDPTTTGASMLPWVRPAALIAGCRAEICAHQKDASGAQMYEGHFEKRLQKMRRINALQIGPQALRLAPELRGRSGGLGYARAHHAEQDYFDEL